MKEGFESFDVPRPSKEEVVGAFKEGKEGAVRMKRLWLEGRSNEAEAADSTLIEKLKLDFDLAGVEAARGNHEDARLMLSDVVYQAENFATKEIADEEIRAARDLVLDELWRLADEAYKLAREL